MKFQNILTTVGIKIHYNNKTRTYHIVPHYDGKDRNKKW